MRILQVVPSYLPGFRYGGPIRSVHGLSKALVARGHDVTVFTTDRDEKVRLDVPLGRAVEIDGVSVRYFGVRGPRRLRYAPLMGGALEREVGDFDLVHSHGLFHWPGQAACRSARQASTPYIVAPRGMLMRGALGLRGRARKWAWIRAVERENLRAARALHVTAELERCELPDLGFELPPTWVLPNGVDPVLPAKASEVRSDVAAWMQSRGRFVLFLGRINRKKGLDRLIETVRLWPSDVRLVVAGPDDGFEAALRRQVESLGLTDRVVWTGAVSGSTRAKLLADAELLALPSYSENFGNVVLEAWSIGTPAVVTPEVGAAELVAEVGAGRVVDGGGIAAGLTEMLADPSGLEAMGRAGSMAVRERFNWDAVAAQLEQALEGEYRPIARAA